MRDQFLVSVMGVVIQIDLSGRGAPFQERVVAAWSDALVHDDQTPLATVRVREEADEVVALELLAADVSLEALAGQRGDGRWMLRAAGIADEQGHVVVLCAPSRRDQVLAARRLTQRYTYVSAEAVGIDDQGGVVPYTKFVRETELPSNLRLSKIVILSRDDRWAEPPEIEVLDLGAALALLTPQSHYLSDLRAPLRTIESLLDATGGAVRVRYRAAADIDNIFDELLHLEPPARPLKIRQRPTRRQPFVNREGSDLYFRGAAADALTLEDARIAVLQRQSSAHGNLVVLNGVASALWAAADGVTERALREAAIDLRGVDEDVDVDRLIDMGIATLLREGILSTTTTWTIADDVAWTTSFEQSTVINLASTSAQPFALEGSSHVIWTVLAEHLSMSQDLLIAECATRFEIDASVVVEDIVAMLRTLQEEGIVIQA